MSKNSFVIYDNWATLLTELPSHQAGELIQAICQYQKDNEYVPQDPVIKGMFAMIKEKLDEDREKYVARCEQNKKNGANGGRNKPNQTESNPNEPKQTHSVAKQSETKRNKADNDNDNDNDNVSTNVDTYKEQVEEIIAHLNMRLGTRYKATTESTKKSITARLKEYSIEDCKSVIDKKCAEWVGTEMEKHLNPTTLFRPSNFERYLNQKINRPGSKKDELAEAYQRLEGQGERTANQ